MTGFNIVGDINDSGAKEIPISSITVSVGELLTLTPGATTWIEAVLTSKFYWRKAVALEAATTASTSVLAQELTGTEQVIATCTNASSVNDNGDSMVLTSSLAVNNAHVNSVDDAVCFVQDGIVDTTHIVGRVIVGSGADVNAT